uniref:LOW QUALITY PROTEIN: SLIT and NTRK-like protein 5 n=1 Tax=Petromyzon marinus TaxID=7757 RepID=A0AAJ7UDP0_PETMA|nr:LOW QUALITY PROTEIN: SLIT and NTRK-like protein 5 [Petromyzon marinus]
MGAPAALPPFVALRLLLLLLLLALPRWADANAGVVDDGGAVTGSLGIAVAESCPAVCSCEERESLLQVDCDNRGLQHVSQLRPQQQPQQPQEQQEPQPTRPYQLHLHGNSIGTLAAGDFHCCPGAVALDLANNGLLEVAGGAFEGMARLRRLRLHGNKLEALRNGTFAGAEGLDYLQADYNLLRRVEAAAFRGLARLRVLILNDNLLRRLPAGVFRGVPLRHLDLRGNRLKALAYGGLLEHLRGVAEIRLEENPWECSCGLWALKEWLEVLAAGPPPPPAALVGEAVCESPFRLHGKGLMELSRRDVCAGGDDGGGDDDDEGGDDEGPRPRPTPAGAAKPRLSVTTTTMPAPASFAGKPHPKPPKPTAAYDRGKGAGDRNASLLLAAAAAVTATNMGPMAAVAGGAAAAGGGGHRQAKPPAPTSCPSVCSCAVHAADGGLAVDCQGRGIERVSALRPRPLGPRRLSLRANSIREVLAHDFRDLGTLELLHLGANRISAVRDGAFLGLSRLRRLHLDGNALRSLSAGAFAGLGALQFLYLESNAIVEVHAGAFAATAALQLLFLNRNRLRRLPAGLLAAATGVTRLNLRGNRLRGLPADGLLAPLGASAVQVDLRDNPWECDCAAEPLRRWLASLSTGIMQGAVACAGPPALAHRDLRSVPLDELCAGDRPAEEAASTAGTAAAPPPAALPPTPAPAHGSLGVPLSVLILGLLAALVTAVALLAALLRRRGAASRPPAADAVAGRADAGVVSAAFDYGRYEAKAAEAAAQAAEAKGASAPGQNRRRGGGPSIYTVPLRAGDPDRQYRQVPLGEGSAAGPAWAPHEHSRCPGAPALRYYTLDHRRRRRRQQYDGAGCGAADASYLGGQAAGRAPHASFQFRSLSRLGRLQQQQRQRQQQQQQPNYDLGKRPSQAAHPSVPLGFRAEGAVHAAGECLELNARLRAEPDYLHVLERQSPYEQF